jgi:hypothetical protein
MRNFGQWNPNHQMGLWLDTQSEKTPQKHTKEKQNKRNHAVNEPLLRNDDKKKIGSTSESLQNLLNLVVLVTTSDREMTTDVGITFDLPLRSDLPGSYHKVRLAPTIGSHWPNDFVALHSLIG